MFKADTQWIPRNRVFLALDIVIIILSSCISFVIRLETPTIYEIAVGSVLFLSFALPIKLGIFLKNGLYRRYWAQAGTNELLLIAGSCLVAGGVLIGVVLGASLAWPGCSALIPRSLPAIDLLLTWTAVAASRFSLLWWAAIRARRNRRLMCNQKTIQRTLIVGAGQTGIQVLETISQSASTMLVVGFLDDDEKKLGSYIRDVQVLGRTRDLRDVIARVCANLVIIAIPRAPNQLLRHIVQICQEAGVLHRIVPGTGQLVRGQVSVNTLRPVAIEDLLGRPPVQLDCRDIQLRLQGRRVLITGAGGSIGSELCLQIARFDPEQILLLGHGENSLFNVESRLRTEFPRVRSTMLLTDIKDRRDLTSVFKEWAPEIVFHAAAHKHVPMLESNVLAAISNNVVGTRNLVELCNQFGVQRFVLISTDKAVNPTSVMGMTKRAAELIVLNAGLVHAGRFRVVRFGNVLGSRGSVVPVFQEQIARGGPVTVTSEQMTRFFMSIPEAAQLVLKASALNECGPLFVLNMGDPVRIMDLAQDLIRLNGAEPGRDIEIRVTGLRPGEKLYEELFWEFERAWPIEHNTIFTLESTAYGHDTVVQQVPELVAALASVVEAGDEPTARTLLREIAFAMPGPLPEQALATVADLLTVRSGESMPINDYSYVGATA